MLLPGPNLLGQDDLTRAELLIPVRGLLLSCVDLVPAPAQMNGPHIAALEPKARLTGGLKQGVLEPGLTIARLAHPGSKLKCAALGIFGGTDERQTVIKVLDFGLGVLKLGCPPGLVAVSGQPGAPSPTINQLRQHR